MHLDAWQQVVLRGALEERSDGKWAAFEVGVEVARQNGKGSILEARELAGLFLLGERLIIHSAHQFDTSLEAFRRLLELIESRDEFSRRVKRVSRAHGEEGIELTTGQRIRFRTRTKGGGRGFTGDCLILDEAMILPESAHGALLPTLSARPNPQVWYVGSAVDQLVHEHGLVFARVRHRALSGESEGLAYFGWSPDLTLPQVTPEIAKDPRVWAQANPGLGIRISHAHVAREQESMDARTFAVERLGVGDWPSMDPEDDQVISVSAWQALVDAQSGIKGPVSLMFDVSPDRSSGAIGAGGYRPDDLRHVEVVDHRPGTGWIVDRLAELKERHDVESIGCDGASPAASLIPELEQRGIDVRVVNAREYAQACGLLFDAVEQKTLRHLDDPRVVDALRGATKRALGDAWAWSRKSSAVDISPLVVVTLAMWAAVAQQPRTRTRLINLEEL